VMALAALILGGGLVPHFWVSACYQTATTLLTARRADASHESPNVVLQATQNVTSN
jgi:hypothetical protein